MKFQINNFLLAIFTAASSMALVSCDKIDQPIRTNNFYNENLYGPVPTFTTLANPIKNVLFEEFTGIKCGYCPDQTLLVRGWDEQYGSRFVGVEIHAGSLAEPGNAPFTADYRTTIGDQYWSALNGGFNPGARINRNIDPTLLWPAGQWLTQLTNELANDPELALQSATSFVESSNVLNVHIHSQALRQLSGEYDLVVLIVESNIISPQEWYGHDPIEVLDYEHDNVLRTGLTSGTGESVFVNPNSGDQKIKSYSYRWNSDWNRDNCSVVAFVIEKSTGRVVNAIEQQI
jgi:hypothetical protein